MQQPSNIQDHVVNAVDTAKEVAANSIELLSNFFQGNPYETYVGKKIESATDGAIQSTENWVAFIDICDTINNVQDEEKNAIRAIKKRLQTEMGKNNISVIYTLTLLETCVKNCNKSFRILTCSKDFVNELIRLIGPKFDAPQAIQEKVLYLIESWAEAFKADSDFKDVLEIYTDLKNKGVQFPESNFQNLVPINTPAASVVTPNSSILQGENQDESQSRGEELSKLRKELDIVMTNINVFQDLLRQLVPNEEKEDEFEFLNELHGTLQEMHRRIVVLIQSVTQSMIFSELLTINDELTASFSKYDRYLVNRDIKKIQKDEETTTPAPPAEHQIIADLADINLNESKPLLNTDSTENK
uniref:VHS domain-containing protein n=1 Tax=Rhabditophanes sp. KR3021 TaxID=114890 RepID=A0AC35U7N8_9BILA